MPAVSLLSVLVPLITFLIATVARFAIRIFMKVFDWSTEIFFGRITTDKSRKLTVLSALSMIWVVMFMCIPFPSIAKITLIFLPKAIRTNKLVIYLLNGSGVFLIPILVGIICIFWDMQINADIIKVHNIKSLQYKQALRGFYYTFFLGLSFVTMFIFSPIIKLVSFVKKTTIVLTPATIQNGKYETVLVKLQKALKQYNIDTKLNRLKIMYNIPMTLISFLSNSLFKDITVRNKMYLYSKDIEIYIHYEDIMLVGKEEAVKKTQTVISEVLMFDTTYLTWDECTQKLENKLLILYSEFVISGKIANSKLFTQLESIKNEFKDIVVDYNDFETIKCQILTVENMMLKSIVKNNSKEKH